MKAFGYQGLMMDANFTTHRATCNQWREYVESEPATLGCLCLEGSVLLKRDTAASRPRSMERAPRDEHLVSKDELKRRMVYKQ